MGMKSIQSYIQSYNRIPSMSSGCGSGYNPGYGSGNSGYNPGYGSGSSGYNPGTGSGNSGYNPGYNSFTPLPGNGNCYNICGSRQKCGSYGRGYGGSYGGGYGGSYGGGYGGGYGCRPSRPVCKTRCDVTPQCNGNQWQSNGGNSFSCAGSGWGYGYNSGYNSGYSSYPSYSSQPNYSGSGGCGMTGGGCSDAGAGAGVVTATAGPAPIIFATEEPEEASPTPSN